MPARKKYSDLSRVQLVEKCRILEKRIDGWGNILTGFGTQQYDRRKSTVFYPNRKLQDEELTNMYRAEGLSKRIIDLPVNDMVREWFTIKNDKDDKIAKKLRSLRTKTRVKEALTWADVYGGSVILMGLKDGGDLEEPVNENNLSEVEFLRVYDKEQVRIEMDDLYKDPLEPKYGQPERYIIQPITGLSEFKVHETRILRFDGEVMPEKVMRENQWWADSKYQAIYDRLKGLGSTYGNLELIIEEFIIGILKVDNLQALIQSGKESLIQKRMNLIDMAKHILNTILVDKDEEFTRISSTLTGLDDAVSKLEFAMSGVTGIPATLLFGQSAKGLNASGEEQAQVRLYYDKINARQEEKLLPQVERLVYLIQIAETGLIEDWSVEFNRLWQPSDKERTDTRKAQAEIDEMYINTMVLTPDEVALSRFGGLEYSYDTGLSDSHKAEIEERERIGQTAVTEGGVVRRKSLRQSPEGGEEDELDEGQE